MVKLDYDATRLGGKTTTFIGLLILFLALIHTHPLWQYLSQGIPYGYHVVPGYETVPLMPGDHLQFYYWCWLMVDNLMGPSAFLTNPYEFNTFLSQGIPGFANFPFSLLYVALYPLGPITAYNALVLLSYLLAGLCAYALAVEVLNDRLAAIPTALIFALLPFRAAQVLSGHLYGFVAFLLPLALWCLERGLNRRSGKWGAGAGLCLLAMGLMEGHLVYYTTLLLGPYVILRLLLEKQNDLPGGGPLNPALGPLLGGLGLGLAIHLRYIRQAGGDLWTPDLAVALGLCVLICFLLWLLLSWLTPALSTLQPGEARGIWSRAFRPLLLAPIYAIQFFLDIPHLGLALLASLILGGLAWSLPALWRTRRRFQLPAGLLKPIWALAAGVGLASAHMLYVKARTFDISIASGGRGLNEVKLFTPHLADIFNIGLSKVEGLIYPSYTLLVLATLGLALLCISRPLRLKQSALAVMWGGLGFAAFWLSLGPTVGQIPLYEFLYGHFPFFKFPRVPGRLIILAVLMLSLLAGWTLRELIFSRLRSRGWAWCLAIVLVGIITLDLWPRHGGGTGICLLPPSGKLEQAVKDHLPTGPQAAGRLLGLPIWPGDSHQSSIYELMISRTRAKVINGYSPVVPRAYVKQVFEPLYPLDLGLVDQGALAALKRNQVKLVAFYDDALIYAAKISPFPPALARQRLAASGAFSPLAQQGNIFLWRLRPEAEPDPAPGNITSSVSNTWQPWELRHDTGKAVEDPQASGWGLLFEEQIAPDAPLGPRKPGLAGNVLQAQAGKDAAGFLSFGPYWVYPPGDYLLRWRLKRGDMSPETQAGYLEVTADEGRRSLARINLEPTILSPDQRWHEVPLRFSLTRLTKLEFRTFFAGSSDLALDVVLLSFAQPSPSPTYYRAQDLWRQTGDLVADDKVPGGLAVRAKKGLHPPLYLMHGPQQTVSPGKYVARFRLQAEGAISNEAEICYLVAALDKGRRTLGYRKLTGRDAALGYHDYEVPFTVTRRAEIGLRVKFLGGASLRLAGVELKRMD